MWINELQMAQVNNGLKLSAEIVALRAAGIRFTSIDAVVVNSVGTEITRRTVGTGCGMYPNVQTTGQPTVDIAVCDGWDIDTPVC
jgi:hypothetical protein